MIRRIDAQRYCHRFTPRQSGSIWSNLNVTHVARLVADSAAGLRLNDRTCPASTPPPPASK